MIPAITPIGHYSDPEYLRILQELMKLGIAPSGNKSVDKTKLEQAKAELIQKVQLKQAQETKNSIQVQPLEAARESEKSTMEEKRLGAMTLSELNKLYFKL